MLVGYDVDDTYFDDSFKNIPHLSVILDKFSGVYLAGGLLRSLVENDGLNPASTDIDLFFRDSGTLELLKVNLENTHEYSKVYQCPDNKLSTFKCIDPHFGTGWKIQLISVDFYPDVETLIESFDFTCTMFGTDGKILVMHEDAISDTESKLLVWNKITYPASSLRRMMKYARKGYHMRESEYQLFIEKIWNHDVNILDEQLVYVD